MSAALLVALFCGSRKWSDRGRIWRDLESLPEGSVVIEGGAPARIASSARRPTSSASTLPRSTRSGRLYGRSAGYRRNEAMARLDPDYVYAYPLGGPGTAQMISNAEAECIPVREP
jgi:hypothetical protein